VTVYVTRALGRDLVTDGPDSLELVCGHDEERELDHVVPARSRRGKRRPMFLKTRRVCASQPLGTFPSASIPTWPDVHTSRDLGRIATAWL
jgi:hypothetical protein